MKKNTFILILAFYSFALFPQQGQNASVAFSSLIFVGDLMAHIDQVQGAWDEEKEQFDFRSSFSYVKPYLEDADITMGNLETTLAGPGGAFQLVEDTAFMGYQGYPFFNTPDAYADALADTGFDILSTANNHSLDSGMEGAIRTHQKIQEKGMDPVGTGLVDDDGIAYRIVNGMKIAFLSYTYCTNQFTIIEDQGFKVNSLNMYQQPLIEDMLIQVRKAADQSDFTVVMIHFGWSYQYVPDDWQKVLTDQLLQAGADFVAGDHPHVLQPMNYRLNGDGEQAFQIYSLSNFISHQRYAGNPPRSRDAGVILKLHLMRKRSGNVEISFVQYMPTWVRMRQNEFTLIPVDPALDNPDAFDLSSSELERLKAVQQESPLILGDPSEPGNPYRVLAPPRVAGNTTPASR